MYASAKLRSVRGEIRLIQIKIRSVRGKIRLIQNDEDNDDDESYKPINGFYVFGKYY